MGMVVRTNAMAINANRQLGVNNSNLSKSLEKLSSGYRINRAGDDASGLAISEKMKAQIKGLDQAASNAQDGISLVQTAEGATTEIHNMLNRMVELATKSANGTIQNDVDREAIQTEVNALTTEISRIADSTNFNGITLLNGKLSGDSSTAAVTAATVNGTNATITTNAATASTYKTTATKADSAVEAKLTVSYKDADGKDAQVTLDYTAVVDGATENADAMVNAINHNKQLSGMFTASNDTGTITVTSKETGVSAPQITSIVGNKDKLTEGTGPNEPATGENAYNSLDLTDLKVGDSVTVNGKTYEMVGADGDTTNTKNATAVVAGTAAESAANLKAALAKDDVTLNTTAMEKSTFKSAKSAAGSGLTLQIGDTAETFNKVTVNIDDLSSTGLGIKNLKVDDQTSAGNAIATIKDAINKVSTNRANLGALQNRMEYTINNLNTTSENMTTANSRIRDTDMASEMTKYTQSNILTQAAQAMLAQANQAPQQILQLLQ